MQHLWIRRIPKLHHFGTPRCAPKFVDFQALTLASLAVAETSKQLEATEVTSCQLLEHRSPLRWNEKGITGGMGCHETFVQGISCNTLQLCLRNEMCLKCWQVCQLAEIQETEDSYTPSFLMLVRVCTFREEASFFLMEPKGVNGELSGVSWNVHSVDCKLLGFHRTSRCLYARNISKYTFFFHIQLLWKDHIVLVALAQVVKRVENMFPATPWFAHTQTTHPNNMIYLYITRGWMKTLVIRNDFDFKFSGFSVLI